jgi:LAGLIDADG DNA endonuclease family
LKIVPSNIQELLTPKGLAYWIRDDGSIQNKGLHLNTYSFKDILKLKSTIVNIFGENTLKCSIHKKGERIYIWGESMDVIRHICFTLPKQAATLARVRRAATPPCAPPPSAPTLPKQAASLGSPLALRLCIKICLCCFAQNKL